MSEIRPPKMCGLFKSGHNPHRIQMSRATEDRGNMPSSGHLVGSQSDGTVIIEADERELSLWNHEPERIAEAAAASGGVVEYQPHWGLLWVPSKGGRYAFSIADASTDHLPCPLDPRVGNPAEHARVCRRVPNFNQELTKAKSLGDLTKDEISSIGRMAK